MDIKYTCLLNLNVNLAIRDVNKGFNEMEFISYPHQESPLMEKINKNAGKKVVRVENKMRKGKHFFLRANSILRIKERRSFLILQFHSIRLYMLTTSLFFSLSLSLTFTAMLFLATLKAQTEWKIGA